MPRIFNCDLHIHTCLSPCADLDMYPRVLVEKSLEKGLDIIAICDHNSSENVQYVIKAAQGKKLIVLPGMEVTTKEEVHILALFDRLDELLLLQEIVYNALPGKNDENLFGCQAIVNEADEVEGLSERLLIGATTLSLKEWEEKVHTLGGLAIAAHIDRQSFSVISQLGFIPEDIKFDALEISTRLEIDEARKEYPQLLSYPFLKSSDAHFLNDIGSASTRFYLEEGTISEMKMALEKRNGRYIME
ncbi:MAG: PHP domain-containing protein [Thermodesulfobacteriota bacterium]|nr:PHP domain-containing protein [Thermodesulfobacteriota bacterium]